MNTWNEIERFWRRSQMPATLILIGINVLTWLLLIFAGRSVPVALLGFSTAYPLLPALWSAVTWPLLGGGDPFTLFFGALWAYNFGGSLERSWGTRTYVKFFVAVNALMALCVWGGAQILNVETGLAGLWAALAAPTVAWCIVNKRQAVSFFIISIPAVYVAYLAMFLLWWRIGPPYLGLFALPACAAAWWYAQKGRYGQFSYGAEGSPFEQFKRVEQNSRLRQTPPIKNRDDEAETAPGFNPLKWWKRRQEDRKLEAMFRRSGYTDDEKK